MLYIVLTAFTIEEESLHVYKELSEERQVLAVELH